MKKRVLAFIFATALALGGCGGGNISVVTEDINEIEIYFVEAGYRTAFMDEWIKAFNVKYPEIEVVELTSNTGATEKATQELANARSTVDIWFTGSINVGKFVAQGKSTVAGYDCVLEELTSLYDEKIPGEDVTIREKAVERLMSYHTINGKEYTLSWASGPSCLLVNRSFGLEVPKTTNQFLAQVQSIADGTAGIKEGVKAFIWPGANAPGYWDYLMDAWKAQYDGIAGYEAYWRMGYEGEAPTYEVLHQEGILESYKVLEQLAKEEYSVYESPQLMHTDAQQAYLRGAAVYMPNGDWFETEMKSTEIEQDIVMAKAPVISALGNKLRLSGGTDEAADERLLISMITDIDDGFTLSRLKEKYSEIPSAKTEAVWEARHVVYNTGFNHLAYIPAYSNAKTASKKFLQFICSDEGIKIFRRYAGSSMPYKYTPEEGEVRTEFQKSLDSIMKDSISFYPTKIWTPLRYLAAPIADSATWLSFYTKEKTSREVYDEIYDYTKKRWKSFLFQAGID